MAKRATSRPVFLNLFRIHLPIGAVASFLHRISGLLLTLALPLGLALLDTSLRGPEGFARVQGWLAGVPVRAGLVILAWALAHHLLAGVRFLLLDVDVGSGLRAARRSAWAVNLLGAAALLAVAGGWL